MNALEILPFILFIVVVVTSIAERINVPYPLLLVVAGLGVGFMPGIPNWHPPSETVLPLFLPPILFAAARTIAWHEIKTHLSTIVFLSIALVFITTGAIALILNCAIPMMTLASAMVLGAIVSPTDTVAAVAIMSKMNVRQNIIRTIELESLFNDATGIVLFNAAVLFVFMGSINAVDISWRTALVGVGGVAVGLIFAYFTRLIIEQFLSESSNELPIIMSLILAYVAYLFADRIGVSGVLAVVAAGLYHRQTERKIQPATRLSETAVWDTLIFFLNGIVFIVIGIQFPEFLKKVSIIPTSQLILYSVITIVSLLLLRFIWVTIVYTVPRFFKRSEKDLDTTLVPWRKIVILSWSGMRGLVPLALAISIPATVAGNQAFPNRNLIVFLTIVTILFTLLVQGLTLPFLIRKLGAGKDDKEELRQIVTIYQQLTKRAIDNMNKLVGDESNYSEESKKLVQNYYTNRLLNFSIRYETEEGSIQTGREAEQLLGIILQHERDLLIRLRKRGSISEDIYMGILSKLDRDEVGFASYR